MVLITISGCGSGYSTAPVSGTVTVDGTPVNGGDVTFAPMGGANVSAVGKPGSGTVQSDGTYSISTYGDNDGAVVGRHRVLYDPPEVETPEVAEGEHAETPESPYAGLVPKEDQVEVVDGSNTIDIELVPGAGSEDE
jgi:hypothetical protein